MRRTLLHIGGPISIQSFGLFIVIGILASTWLVIRNPKRRHIISEENFKKAIIVAIISGIIGGRLLYILEEYNAMQSILDFANIWEGGFSSLGTVIAVLTALPLYLKKIRVPVLPFFDLITVYAPLTQSISRLGCFMAGCCYGAKTKMPWAIKYNDQESIAPLGTYLHPTQLYSSLVLLLIFLIMRYFFFPYMKKPGQLTSLYLMLSSSERFLIDFFRGDRTFLATQGALSIISTHQWIALSIITAAATMFIIISHKSKKNS